MSETDSEATSAEACQGGSMPTSGDIRVLVVDDQATFRSAVADLVDGTQGCQLVGAAADGAAALVCQRQDHPDLVLLDINLGDESGIDVARELAADGSPRIVLMSTYAADDLPAEAATCGAYSYLHKGSLTPATLVGLLTEPDSTRDA